MRCKLLRFWLAAAVLGSSALAGAATDAPLAAAVQRGDTVAIRQLLDRKVGINVAQPDGTTALHWATHQDNPELVSRLLAAGAEVRLMNRYGVMPLAIACQNGNAAIITKLLDAGADVHASLPGGETMLMTAARTGKVDAVRVLV
ncbi:MAG TPA: ankyrin repeat domain-containing protein, partial [Vicinamibacterales bacterium]|nr:ankyrin repeat domain-containing protein [Vicinamibacterales bacterium]